MPYSVVQWVTCNFNRTIIPVCLPGLRSVPLEFWTREPPNLQTPDPSKPYALTAKWFRVWGSGFRVQGSGFRVSGFGFRGLGLGFRSSRP